MREGRVCRELVRVLMLEKEGGEVMLVWLYSDMVVVGRLFFAESC